jgi:DNA-binding response OmpR family regulator
MRILEVEDDDLLGSAMQKGLRQLGYAVDWVQKGADVDTSMATHRYDAVLLDLGLPDIAGEVLLKTIRAREPGICVVVMTARHGIRDRVQLLDMGADDYMVKPVDMDELSARLRAVLRRATAVPPQEYEEFGALRLYPGRRTATWHGELVVLTNKEYWLLDVFVRRRNEVLTRARLEEALYGWGEEIESNAVEVYVHFLRRKFSQRLIMTIRGVGYQLAANELQI